MKRFLASVLFLALAFLNAVSWGYNLDATVRQDVRKWGVQEGIDLSVNVSFLFIPQIVELEERRVGLFGRCKVFTDPLTLEKLGLTYEQYGVVDPIKGQYLQGLYGSYSDVGYVVDVDKVIEYAECLARYGAILAQAQLNLQEALKKYGKVLKGHIKGRMELEEFKRVVERALLDAVKTKKYSPAVQNVMSRLKIKPPCKFTGSPGAIMCGAYLLSLQPPQRLTMQGFPLFSEGNFFGIGGQIRVSKGAGSEATSFEYIPLKNQ
jgi:hypothetical protein